MIIFLLIIKGKITYSLNYNGIFCHVWHGHDTLALLWAGLFFVLAVVGFGCCRSSCVCFGVCFGCWSRGICRGRCGFVLGFGFSAFVFFFVFFMFFLFFRFFVFCFLSLFCGWTPF